MLGKLTGLRLGELPIEGDKDPGARCAERLAPVFTL